MVAKATQLNAKARLAKTARVFSDIIGAATAAETARVFTNIIGGKPPNAIAKAARFNPKAPNAVAKAQPLISIVGGKKYAR